VRIHSAIWVRIPYNLVHCYEYFGGAFLVYLHKQSIDGYSISYPIIFHYVYMSRNILRIYNVNNKIYCLISVFTCFVIISKFAMFLVPY
jgi:hypothetical protein